MAGRYARQLVVETREAVSDGAGTWSRASSSPSPPRWVERHGGWTIAIATLVVGLPLLVALVALRGEPWFPVLDLAMTEFRVRDAFTSDSPLIGLPGRIGEYPEQGSHPGPLSFYLLAPVYLVLGSTSWALEAGTVAIHLAAMATALWIGWRALGGKGVAAVAALLALVVRGYGQVPLTQPWNPYLPLLAWIVVLLAAWAVVAGHHRMLLPLVLAATYTAQTHVPYLLLGVGVVTVGVGAVIVQLRRSAPDERRSPLISLGWAAGVGVVLWLPPLVDQLTNRPGNIRQLLDHFGSPPEAAIGFGEGAEIMLRHLDAWYGIAGQVLGQDRFVDTASPIRGALTLAVWLFTVGVAWRIGSRSLNLRALKSLHVVVAVALLLGTISAARIFGRPWFYLTLWAWGITTLLVGAVIWTAVTWWQARSGRSSSTATAAVAAIAATVALVASLTTSVAFAAGAEHPEERLSQAVGTLADPTYEAVVDGVGAATGADGSYLVRWSDAADIGSPGFGLLNELERRGLDVAADEYFHVPVTDHRTRPRAEADAQIHLATGGHVDIWRGVPDAVEVATYDPRARAERAEYASIRSRFIDRLNAEGLTELVPLVDTNLFGMSVDTRLTPDDQADLGRLIELGQPMVVFLAPPPADDDPTAL